MEMRILLVQGIAVFYVIAVAVAEVLENKASLPNAPRRDAQERPNASVRFQPGPSAGTTTVTNGKGPFADFGNMSFPNNLIRASTFEAKDISEINRMWAQTIHYQGPSNHGLSGARLRALFAKYLVLNVIKHLSRSLGGVIFEFGDRSDRSTSRCEKRPSLSMHEVREVARASFGIPEYNITYPVCNGEAVRVRCNYDGGVCCRRPQVEFIGRYYDTAVAAMALGATREEAFAPLMHARILAYVLENCDPDLSFRSHSRHNDFKYRVKSRWGNQYYTRKSAPARRSLISFPVAYEVLYEVYNTMLIERIRRRGETRFPTHRQMQSLNNALYYKKMMASAAYVDLELNPYILFPESKHFESAGLVMTTSSRLSQVSRMKSQRAVEVEPRSGDIFDLHPGLRFAGRNVVSVFEIRTMRSKVLDGKICNTKLPKPRYYPYKFQEKVFDHREGCCAMECKFMALYGRTFKMQSSNCCAGCNRYRCLPNNLKVAAFLAKISRIESPKKKNSGPEAFAVTA